MLTMKLCVVSADKFILHSVPVLLFLFTLSGFLVVQTGVCSSP